MENALVEEVGRGRGPTGQSVRSSVGQSAFPVFPLALWNGAHQTALFRDQLIALKSLIILAGRPGVGHPPSRARPTRYLIGGPIDCCVESTFGASWFGRCLRVGLAWRGALANTQLNTNYFRTPRAFVPGIYSRLNEKPHCRRDIVVAVPRFVLAC